MKMTPEEFAAGFAQAMGRRKPTPMPEQPVSQETPLEIPTKVEFRADLHVLHFCARHSGDQRTLAVWLFRGEPFSLAANALAIISSGREQAHRFLDAIARCEKATLRGNNAHLVFEWASGLRFGLGVTGGWRLVVTRLGAKRPLRSFPFQGGYPQAKRMAERIGLMLDSDLTAQR